MLKKLSSATQPINSQRHLWNGQGGSDPRTRLRALKMKSSPLVREIVPVRYAVRYEHAYP